MGNYIAGIVLYNPDIERLKENVSTIENQVNKIILVDNGSENIRNVESIFHTNDNIVIIKNKKNLGIASALNTIMQVAKSDNHEWCLLLDQDTITPDNIILKYDKFIKFQNNISNIAIISPNINDINSPEQINNKKNNNYYDYISKCITSGSLNSIAIWEKMGGFDERIFIDGVDHDYCVRVSKDGFKIVRLNNVVIMHEIGKIKYKRYGPVKLFSYNHSAFRKYYITRNIILLDKKYNNKVSLKSYLRILKQILLVILVEDKRSTKIMAIKRGIKDGRKICIQ